MNPSAANTPRASAAALAGLAECTHGFSTLAWLRTLAAGLRSWFRTPRAMRRAEAERDALCGLNAHVLRDIGASPSLVADALACARDDYPVDYDRNRY
jgi:hypothetical protein